MKRANIKFFFSAVFWGVLGSIPLVIQFVFYTMPMFEEKTTYFKKESTSIAVQSVFNILDVYHQREKAGELTKIEAQKAALELIKQLRYNGSEYFWINDLKPTMIMHPIKSELDGKDVSSLKDPDGKFIFIDMAKAAEKNRNGDYVEYHWPKPGSENPVPKVSFVKLYEPWGWVIGNGVYLDDINALNHDIRTKNFEIFFAGLAFLLSISLFIAWRQIRRWVIPVQDSMANLQTNSAHLNQSQARMSESTDSLFKSTDEQQAAVSQISSAITQVQSMIETSSEITKQSVQNASLTFQSSQKGITSIEEVRKAFGDIQSTNEKSIEAFNTVTDKITAINQIISEISSKAQMINDVVFQTKLLSFNASVEAARAGAQGKGFAVVAEEIANLAKSSGHSAQEIESILVRSKKLVSEIAQSSKDEASIMSDATQTAIRRGTESVENCKIILNDVSEKARNSDTLMSSIAKAHHEQEKGVNDILNGISLINQRATSNASEMKTSLEIAEQISEISNSINAVVMELKAASGSESNSESEFKRAS